MGWLFKDEVGFGGDGPTAESETDRRNREREADLASARRGRRFWSLVKRAADGVGDAFDGGTDAAGSMAQRAYGVAQKATDVDDWRRAADEMTSGSWSIWRGDR